MKDKIVLTFSKEELQTLERIDLDSDRDEALRFIRETIGKKLKELNRPHCVPVFEVTYSPRQKEAFQKTSAD